MAGELPFDVPKTLAAKNTANFPMMKLEWPTPDLAVYEPTKALRRAGMIFTTMGIAAGVAGVLVFFLVSSPVETGVPHSGHGAITFLVAAPVVVVATVFAVIGAAFARGKFGAKRIVFDRRQKMIFKEAKKLDPVWEGGIPMRAIAAVQLVCDTTRYGPFRTRTYSSGNNFLAFEVNLVLSSPRGERVNLVSHAKGDLLRTESAELAKFLNVPLLDHTQQG